MPDSKFHVFPQWSLWAGGAGVRSRFGAPPLAHTPPTPSRTGPIPSRLRTDPSRPRPVPSRPGTVRSCVAPPTPTPSRTPWCVWWGDGHKGHLNRLGAALRGSSKSSTEPSTRGGPAVGFSTAALPQRPGVPRQRVDRSAREPSVREAPQRRPAGRRTADAVCSPKHGRRWPAGHTRPPASVSPGR